MPAGFSPQERARIVEKLLATAAGLFTTQGVRKTTLDELVRPAGIAKSSFYAFFDSKEALYLELMNRQVPELHARLVASLRGDDPTDVVRRVIRSSIDVLRTNALYHRLITHPDELEAVSRRLSTEDLARNMRLLQEPIIEFLRQAQGAGTVIEGDPNVLFTVMRFAMAAPLVADRMDPAAYPDALDLLVDIVATGLTARTKNGPRHGREHTGT